MKYVTVNANTVQDEDLKVLEKQANGVAKMFAKRIVSSQNTELSAVYANVCALVLGACATRNENTIRRCVRIGRTFGVLR
jgi:hypothetical protein